MCSEIIGSIYWLVSRHKINQNNYDYGLIFSFKEVCHQLYTLRSVYLSWKALLDLGNRQIVTNYGMEFERRGHIPGMEGQMRWLYLLHYGKSKIQADWNKTLTCINKASQNLGLFLRNFVQKRKQLTCWHMFLLISGIISTTYTPNKAVAVVPLRVSFSRASQQASASSPLNINKLVPHLLQGVSSSHIAISWEDEGLPRITRGDGYYSVPTGFRTLLFVFY